MKTINFNPLWRVALFFTTLASLSITLNLQFKTSASAWASAEREGYEFDLLGLPDSSRGPQLPELQWLSWRPFLQESGAILDLFVLSTTWQTASLSSFEPVLVLLESRFYPLRQNQVVSETFYTDQGHAHLHQGNIRGAISSYLIALTLNPQNTDIYFHLSNIYLGLSDYQLALGLLDRAEIIQGPAVAIDLERANILLRSGELDAARQYLDRVFSTEPENSTAQLYLGDIYMLDGNFELALLNYQEVMAAGNLTEKIAPRLGTLWMRQQDYLRAVVYYRYWSQCSPDNPEAFYSLGRALGYRGRYDEARDALREAANLYLSQEDFQGYETVRVLQQHLESLPSK